MTASVRALLILSVLLLDSSVLFADMSTHFGLSPRGIGMANAVSSVIDDYASVYYNPAGLSLSPESGFTLGYFYSQPRVKTEETTGTSRLVFESAMRAGVIGYRQKLFSDSWKKNVVVGMALAYPDNFKTGTLVHTYLYDEMQFPVFGRIHDMLVMSGGVGIEVHERVYVGTGMRFAVTYSAQDITLKMNLANGDVLFQHVDVNADTEVQPIVGIILKPLDRLNVAAVWRRGGAPVRIAGKGSGGAELGAFSLPVSLDLNFRDFYTPDEIACGLACGPFRRFLVAIEATYAQWSGYDVPYDRKPPGEPFRDIVIPRLGVEYSLSDLVKIQAGYYYQKSPVKKSQPHTVYLDAHEHVFSAATQVSLPLPRVLEYPLQFHAYFQFQHLPRRCLETLYGPIPVWGYLTNIGGTVQLRF